MTKVVGLTPFERPDARLVRTLVRAGRTAVLDLGRDPSARARALDALRGTPHGVRIPEGVTWSAPLPAQVTQVIAPVGTPSDAFGDVPVWWEVRTVAEAREAVAAGCAGVVGVGHEAGGRVGPESAFVLCQRLAAADLGIPFWIRGGIGPHSAAACAVAGADAVVLDGAIACARDVDLPATVHAAVRAMDGSETVVVGGVRVFTRPDLPAAKLEAELADDVLPRLGADDLHDQLLPTGQDAAFASDLADRFGTAAAICAHVEAALDDHLAHARDADALAEHSPLAASHGTRWPVVQGPMTRVSDTPAFADAVADAGALPFVALSMLRADKARALLTETAAVLGDRPWGVGILGFVPPELREPQLQAILDVRPPVALIAGGRPSQARELEDAGIATWLHAPSPALTRAFLADGARRFVFEGRECGGHVGPRSSFVLWSQQLDVLLAHDDLSDVEVLFAGGIHDARSAAMVAALSGPLAARGAKVGLLMGTAYLFTEEAVASGAILADFQAAAVQAETTALLETAPGHATRCAPTPFVEHFAAEKARLAHDAVPPKEAWAELESLNVGRLRIASKGIERQGQHLVEVDAARRQQDGMVMLGEVAALRDRVTTMAALHADVCEGGRQVLGVAAAQPVEAPGPAPCDVAIVGMAAVLPGAPDLDTYWQHILDGVDAITEVPDERWRADLYFDPDGTPGETTPSKWGGLLPEVRFDPLAYGIPPSSLSSIDPAQLLALEVSARALADAGYDRRPFARERASVIFGTESGSDLGAAYSFRAHYRQFAGELPAALDEALPTLTEDSFPGVLANVLAGRIANRLDLGGVNYTVDAACASSLAALDLAVKELTEGSSDLVLCGGADLHNGINDYLLFSSTHALSPKGRCATFDADADGIVLGEGVAALVLKRLDDAVADGDRIYAVVKGVGGSSDGRSLGLTAPRKDGQKRAVVRAWAQAGLDPADAGLVEAHGTGTIVGDRTELGTLTETFAATPGRITLGSVKSQIGHTKCAAGLAGLIKVALAIHHGVRPPTSRIATPNPAWSASDSPFHFTDAPRPWLDANRIAAVSAFGFGGTNFHAVLQGVHAAPERPDGRRAELFLLRGASADVSASLDLLAARAADPEPHPLAALARATCARGRGPVALALVATDHADLADAVALAQAGTTAPHRVLRADTPLDGEVAFLFPGQGSQRPGMLRDLFVDFPDLQRFLALDPELADLIHPPQAFDRATLRAQRDALTDTRSAQPALGLVDLAVAAWLGELGVHASLAGGHSYGELAALAWAGAMDAETLLAVSRARAACILDAAPDDPGAMAAVSAPIDLVADAVDGLPGVVIANHNAPEQTVVAGPTDAIEEAVARLDAAGLPARRIPVACAFHSPMVADAVPAFRAHLDAVTLHAPRVPVWSNTTAAPHTADDLRDTLAAQIGQRVRFVEQVEAMYAAGARVFVEVGPGRVLTGLVGRILGERPHRVVQFEGSDASGPVGLLAGIATLATAGVSVRADALFAGRDIPHVDLTTPAPAGRAPWIVDGHRARPVSGPTPRNGLVPILEPLGQPAASVASEPGETAVLAFLDNMRSLADAQRDAMLAFLDATPGARRDAPARREASPLTEVTEAEIVPDDPSPAPDADVPLLPLLTGIVSDLTGYPAEMLDAEADLEADLSIDSIKRIEILSLLGERLGDRAGAIDDRAVETLAAKKTLGAMVAWLEAREAVDAAPSALVDATSTPVVATTFPIRRYRMVPTASPLEHAEGLPGHVSVIDPDATRGLAIADALRARGLTVDMVDPDDGMPADAEAVIQLDGAGPTAAFGPLRAALEGGARRVLGFESGSPGLDGLYRTAAREYPDRQVRLVSLDDLDPTRLADLAAIELGAGLGPSHVQWRAGERQTLVVSDAPLADAGGALPLDPDSVVLLTGGARGITAAMARAMATEVPCTYVLVGRSPLRAASSDPDLRAAPDAAALRKVLIARGGRPPAAIESRVRDVLRGRELRANLEAIEATGATVEYRTVDVSDADAFGELLADVYARHDRLDGVVHGAGILEDKLMRDKTPESFSRVYETKVTAARVLLDQLRDDARFVVFFGSISGVLGNRGQADYAAANSTLDALASQLGARITGRVVSIDWGPWGGAGMVSPELARAYARKGIPLIDLDEGVAAFLDEIRHGDREEHQVIWQAGHPDDFAEGRRGGG